MAKFYVVIIIGAYTDCRAHYGVIPWILTASTTIKCHIEHRQPYYAASNTENIPIAQITQSTCPISHNTPFRTEMYTFLFLMVYCRIWDRCIMGHARLVSCVVCGGFSCIMWYIADVFTNHTPLDPHLRIVWSHELSCIVVWRTAKSDSVFKRQHCQNNNS